MDPTALLLAGIAYAAAEVARKVADEVATRLWTKVRNAWASTFGTEPQARDVTPASLEALAEQAPELADELRQLIGQSGVLRRLTRVQDAVAGARILWVDDHPEWNSWEIACLEAAGARVRTVETTRAGLALVADGYDAVVSDVDREGKASEGIDALPLFHGKAPTTPIILYVGQLQSTSVPAGAFGITNQPDELLHLVLDVLERARL